MQRTHHTRFKMRKRRSGAMVSQIRCAGGVNFISAFTRTFEYLGGMVDITGAEYEEAFTPGWCHGTIHIMDINPRAAELGGDPGQLSGLVFQLQGDNGHDIENILLLSEQVDGFIDGAVGR